MTANPVELFEKHFLEWTDDFKHQAASKGLALDEKQLKTLVLMDLQKRMQSRERSLASFRLPEPTQEELEAVNINDLSSTDALLSEELNFIRPELMELVIYKNTTINSEIK